MRGRSNIDKPWPDRPKWIAGLVMLIGLSAIPGCDRTNAGFHTDAHPLTCAGPVRLSVLGDSLARGWGASKPRFTLVNRLFRHVNERRAKSRLYNLSAPGVTARQILARQLPRLQARACSVVFIVAGANEVQQFERPVNFGNDYERLLAAVSKRDPKAVIIAAGVPDVSLAPRIPVLIKPVLGALSSMDNDAILELAARHHAFAINYFRISHERANSLKHLGPYASQDGLHPSDAGYAVMAKAAYATFDTAIPVVRK